MNHSIKYILFSILSLLICSSLLAQTSEQKRQKLLMDFNWKFRPVDNVGAERISYDDAEWRMLNLPHDWSVEGDFSKDASAGGNGGYLPTGIGWYRRHFQISRGELNKKVWIEFDGVYMNIDVWINEHHLGHYPNGYNSFYYELTPYLKEGENVIAVKVDNSQQPNSRWYTGSGIYRHVWLVITDPLHISNWGVTVTTPQVSKESAIIEIKTKIENNYDNLRDGVLQTILLNKDGLEIAQTETSFSIESGKDSELIQQFVLKSPELWSIDSPVLYKVHSVVLDGKKKVDDVTTDIGIRKIEFDKDKGFFLNDEHIKMKGVCLHHDGGCVGAAVPERIWERRLQKLKEMGCNAIRTSHNPPHLSFWIFATGWVFLLWMKRLMNGKLVKGNLPIINISMNGANMIYSQ